MISWIPEGHTAVLELFGQYNSTLNSGVYFYIPGLHTFKSVRDWHGIASKQGYLIEKAEQQTSTPARRCQTKDNVSISASASISWKIIDPKKCVYVVDNLPNAISDIALNTLRSSIGMLDFHEVVSSRESLNQKITGDLNSTVEKWGIKLLRMEIQELTYSEETGKAIMKEMIAEREKKAKISQAEGESHAEITRAKAHAEAILVEAKAQAEAEVLTAEARAIAFKMQAGAEREYLNQLKQEVGPESAANLLEIEKNRLGLENITKNPSHKVFINPNASLQLRV